ncbi:uncharacterized protein LOC128963652 [Oppia nitens]|uniref:uncharacterized protein LOC128963652 n=1 Tax=Oppia nitens TaxID=1686743 RepID=UPI0023DB8FA4|nr:uncharacterized protein LOC128963652 [Oppia nitens]
MWTKLSNELNDVMTEEVDVKQLSDEFDRKSRELTDIVKDTKRFNKEKLKHETEIKAVEMAITKAETNISKAEDKCSRVQQYIEKMTKKSDENKENVENVMNIWNTVGLRMEKHDKVYTIKFNKISDSEPNKWFTVKMSVDSDQIKVVDCDPEDSLQPMVIEKEFGSRGHTKPDLRHFIAFVRNILKNKYSK